MKRIAFGILVTLALAAPSSAVAELFSGSAGDQQGDVEPSILGKPNLPDLKKVTATFDNAQGSFRFVVDFYGSVDDLSFSPTYRHDGSFYVSTDECEDVVPNLWLSGSGPVAPPRGGVGEFSVSGFSGSAAANAALSQDGTRVTFAGQAAPLVGARPQCFDFLMGGRDYSSASNPLSHYDSQCGCWSTFRLGDSLDGRVHYFDGLKPPRNCDGIRLRINGARHDLRFYRSLLRRAIRQGSPNRKIRSLRRHVRRLKREVDQLVGQYHQCHSG